MRPEFMTRARLSVMAWLLSLAALAAGPGAGCQHPRLNVADRAQTPQERTMRSTLFIFYVHDQDRSMAFYSQVLAQQPVLHVPGMTEFALPGGGSLGLMPERGISRLLGDRLPDPSRAAGIPRAELYLTVDDAQDYQDRTLGAGATELSALQLRDWGDRVA